MSAFKRYQSKVFWDQMASHDLEDNRSVERSDSSHNRLQMEGEEDDDSTNKSENDTTNSGEITTIYVCKNPNEDVGQNACWISLTRDHENVTQHRIETEDINEELENEITEANRSHQEHKSQDSGFSDSEKSDSGNLYENATPRRKLRRKKIRQRRIRLMITSPLLGEGSLLDPIRTSTPKDCKILLGRRNLLKKSTESSLQEQSIGKEEEEEAQSISLEDEHLEDFLYASEPPEDGIQSNTTAKSLAFTDIAEDIAISTDRSMLRSRSYLPSSSITAWLTDLATKTENECDNTLQSKHLPRGRALVISGEVHARDLKMLCSAATAAASKLLVKAEQFEQHYRNIVEKITHLEGGRSEMGLLRNIEEAAVSFLFQLGAPPPRRIQQGSLKSILAQLYGMKMYIDGTIDTRLDFYIEKIIRSLDETQHEDSSVVKGALAALTALGLSDSRAGSSIARCSGIKALLTYVTGTGYRVSDDLVALSLRALASICSSATAIEYFATDNGPEILTDLLKTQFTSEKEKTEATALVVQITAPWTNALGLPYLEPFADSLIPALNRLIESTSCAQTLLLAAAALNQMSKSQLCASIILMKDSVKTLLRSVKKAAVGGNVWLMEQVAALIGELARVPEGRLHLAKVHASVALVSFLRMRPPGLEDAYHRLEITATTALTRLCVEPEIAQQVVAVGGGDCLPICRIDDARTTRNDEAHVKTGFSRCSRSLRRACKKAAKQIGIAKAKDHKILE